MYDDTADLIASYRAAPAILAALLSDPAIRDAAPADGWSAREVLGHYIDAEVRTHERIVAMRDQDDPFLAVYPDLDPPASIEAGLAEFSRLRGEHLATLRALPADAWHRTGRHPKDGPITIIGLTRHIAAHDVEHLAQLIDIGRGG